MNIKINDFHPITHKHRLEVVGKYLKEFEKTELTNNGIFNSLKYEYSIKETGKYPIILEVGSYRYHVKCRKTKTCLVFDIWLAS